MLEAGFSLAVDAARLRILVETQGVREAGTQLQNLGVQIDKSGQSAQKAGGGLAALDRHALNAKQRADALGKSVATSGTQMDAAGKQANRMGDLLGSTHAKSMLATAGFAGAAVAATQLGRSGVAAFMDFDMAMNQSLAIMGDVSDAMRRDMADAAREVARTTTFSATEAAESYFFLASAGLDAQQSIAAMPQVAAFAQAGMFNMAVATDLLTDAQSALGLTSSDTTTNLQEMARVSDVLVKANTLANASVQQFSESLTTRAGAALKLVNKDIEEGVAVLAAMADQGVKGAEAGTRLDIVLRDLQTSTLRNREEFDKLGISVFDSQGNMNNMADIIADLENALEGMSDEQARATLMQLGFQDRSVASILTLLGLSDQIRQYESDLRDAAGTTQEVADNQLQSLSAQLDLAKSSLADSAIAMGNVATESGLLGLTIDALAGNARGLNYLARSLEWVGTAASDLPDVLPSWLSGSDGGRIEAGWRSVGNSMRAAALQAVGGPAAALIMYDGGQEAGESYAAGFRDAIVGKLDRAIEEALKDGMWWAGNADAAFGPFFEEVLIGPLVAIKPQFREEIAEIFSMSPDVGSQFVASITEMVGRGAMSYEEGLSILGALPSEILQPELKKLESDWQGLLVDALLSGEDNEIIRRRLEAVQMYMDETSQFVASSAVGFNEFATAGERAMSDVATAADGLQIALDGLAGAYQIGLDVQQQFTGQASEYASGQKNIENALEAVQRKQEEGIELSEAELRLLDMGEDAIARYVGGQEDATIQAGLAATANAELMKAQDDLNRAIQDGETDLEPYLDRVKDAEQFARDMGLGTDANTEAQNLFVEAIEKVVERLEGLMEGLGLIPPEVEINILLNDEGAYNQAAAFREAMRNNPATIDLFVNQITQQGFTANNAQGGVLPQGGLSWVGEEGPELLYIPPGGQIFDHHTSNEMAGRIPGFAQGTGANIELTDADRMAIKILGEMDVVITPASMAQAEADLAAMLNARQMAIDMGLGEAVIAQLDEDIAAKQGELELIGRIAGSAYGQGFLGELAATDATQAMAGLLGSFSLDDIVSGKAGTDLGQQFVDLLQLERIALEMGDLDLAAMYREQADTVGAELERLGQVMSTEFVQGQIDGYNAEQVAAEWDARLADALAGPAFGAGIQATIDDLDQKIDLGILMGTPMSVIEAWQAEKDALVSEGESYWLDVARSIAAGAFSDEEIQKFAEVGGAAFMGAMETVFSPEAIDKMFAPVVIGLESLEAMFAESPEMAGQFVDDIIIGINDGRYDMEQAFGLLASIPEDQMIPTLEKLEQQWTQGVVQAILDGEPEMEAYFNNLLGMLRGVEEQVLGVSGAINVLDRAYRDSSLSGGGSGSSADVFSGGAAATVRAGNMPEPRKSTQFGPSTSSGGASNVTMGVTQQAAYIAKHGVLPPGVTPHPDLPKELEKRYLESNKQSVKKRIADYLGYTPTHSFDSNRPLASIPAYADGGLHSGGLAIVGERGPELVNLPGGSHIFSNTISSPLLSLMDSGGSVASPSSGAIAARQEATDRRLDAITERLERIANNPPLFQLPSGEILRAVDGAIMPGRYTRRGP